MEAVIETRRSSYTMVDVLEEMGIAGKIAHPNEVKAIARANITDRTASPWKRRGEGPARTGNSRRENVNRR